MQFISGPPRGSIRPCGQENVCTNFVHICFQSDINLEAENQIFLRLIRCSNYFSLKWEFVNGPDIEICVLDGGCSRKSLNRWKILKTTKKSLIKNFEKGWFTQIIWLVLWAIFLLFKHSNTFKHFISYFHQMIISHLL